MGKDDFEVEGMEGADPIGIRTGDEPDMGAVTPAQQNRVADARFDPAILFSEIKAYDWRIDAGTNAMGVNHPAVQAGGEIHFFEPVPSDRHSNWAGDTGGGKSPWPFRAVKMSVEMLCPPTPTWARLPAVPPATVGDIEQVVAHSQMLASIILRGTLTMEFGDIVILKDAPVSQIGAAGGAHLEGDQFGSAQNMMQAWTNAFKLPDELIFNPDKGSALKATIRLNKGDLLALGTEAGEGWGHPFSVQHQISYTPPVGGEVPTPEKFTTVSLLPLAFGVRLNLWGQRGLNIRAGRSSLVKATAERR
ncbi:MAG: hypothetical protein PHW08_14150 [Kiritimatiellae bacterium]|nr:hypothetical protein [Kiritimatiellia bacterium]